MIDNSHEFVKRYECAYVFCILASFLKHVTLYCSYFITPISVKSNELSCS